MILFTVPGQTGRSSVSRELAEKMYEKYSDMIYRIAYVRTLSSADSQDILQEVFCRYIRSNPDFADEGHCRAWFIRTAVNCSSSLLSSAWRRRTVFGQEPADETYERMERDTEVYHAVMQLPPGQRMVVHLYYYEDLSVEQTARIVGASVSAVKSRLMRARETLRRQLEEDFDV